METIFNNNNLDYAPMIKLQPEHWEYFAEGNLHIVFVYRGKDSKLLGKILKLEKIADTASSRDKIGKDQQKILWLSRLLNDDSLCDLTIKYINPANKRLSEVLPQNV